MFIFSVEYWSEILLTPTYALPIDLFRILVGILSFVYFLRTYFEAKYFSNLNGVIDHKLSYTFFPYTRLSFFQPGMNLVFFHTIFFMACLASLSLAIGEYVNLASGFLFIVAVSTYRWNFLVVYVDDLIMHLTLFWIILLPVGHTLVLRDWMTQKTASYELWQTIIVPGATMRLFLFNLAIVYVAAGLWKWTSPMWRDGTALFISLKIPISRVGLLLKPSFFPFLKFTNYFVLISEPLFPLMFILPINSLLKWVFLVSAIGFHLGIALTMKVPFANLAMASAAVLILRDEIMQFILIDGSLYSESSLYLIDQPSVFNWVAFLLVTCILLMVLWRAGLSIRFSMLHPKDISNHINPFHIPLWIIGIAQSYRLFDWIDNVNYHVSYDMQDFRDNAKEGKNVPQLLFPTVATRHILLQSYLHGDFWLQEAGLNAQQIRELRSTIYKGYIQNYCNNNCNTEVVEVYAITQWVTSENLNLDQGVRKLLVKFSCQDGHPIIYYCQDLSNSEEYNNQSP